MAPLPQDSVAKTGRIYRDRNTDEAVFCIFSCSICSFLLDKPQVQPISKASTLRLFTSSIWSSQQIRLGSREKQTKISICVFLIWYIPIFLSIEYKQENSHFLTNQFLTVLYKVIHSYFSLNSTLILIIVWIPHEFQIKIWIQKQCALYSKLTTNLYTLYQLLCKLNYSICATV